MIWSNGHYGTMLSLESKGVAVFPSSQLNLLQSQSIAFGIYMRGESALSEGQTISNDTWSPTTASGSVHYHNYTKLSNQEQTMTG